MTHFFGCCHRAVSVAVTVISLAQEQGAKILTVAKGEQRAVFFPLPTPGYKLPVFSPGLGHRVIVAKCGSKGDPGRSVASRRLAPAMRSGVAVQLLVLQW